MIRSTKITDRMRDTLGKLVEWASSMGGFEDPAWHEARQLMHEARNEEDEIQAQGNFAPWMGVFSTPLGQVVSVVHKSTEPTKEEFALAAGLDGDEALGSEFVSSPTIEVKVAVIPDDPDDYESKRVLREDPV